MPEEKDKEQKSFENSFEQWQRTHARDAADSVALRAIAWYSLGLKYARREVSQRISELRTMYGLIFTGDK